jgi:MFS-type transporter involved in bile tolerance (Atg22 family)
MYRARAGRWVCWRHRLPDLVLIPIQLIGGNLMVRIAFVITALFYALSTIPLLLHVRRLMNLRPFLPESPPSPTRSRSWAAPSAILNGTRNSLNTPSASSFTMTAS